jgi:hypothetical protein
MNPPWWVDPATSLAYRVLMGIRTVRACLSCALGVTLLAVAPASGAEVAVAPAAEPVPAPTVLQAQSDVKRVGPSDRVTVTGRLLTEADRLPVADEQVLLQYQRIGRTGWQDGETANTGLEGRAEWTVRLTNSTRFRVMHLESAAAGASLSPVRKVQVKPVLSVSLRREWVRPGGVVKLQGRARPGFGGERVMLQRLVNGRWATVSRVQQGGQGRFLFRIEGMDRYGPQRYRVALDARYRHLSATSKRITLTTVRVVTYRIETRGNVSGALKSFQNRTAEIYSDLRGWSRSHIHFSQVTNGGAFSLVLSQAELVPSFAPICSSYYSCRVGRYVVINADRWRRGTPYLKSSGATLRQYRALVVNHETGHWLGLGHSGCGGSGMRAPVMMQQSKGLFGCTPNAWPLPGEVARTR